MKYLNIYRVKNIEKQIGRTISLFAILMVLGVTALGQSIHPIESIGKHYKTLANLNPAPDPDRSSLDRIEFPWVEYGSGALTNSLMRTVYLIQGDEAKLDALIRFPANSSRQTRAELDYLLELQNKRTKDNIARAEFIATIGPLPNILNPTGPDYIENRRQLFYIATPVGQWFTSDNFPEVTNLLINCIQDIRVTEFRLKGYFRRPRPYHLEPQLNPITRMQSPSFPSGHTLWAFSQAYIFSEIIPEKRDEFLKLAEEVRWSRELMGIHYPSDNEASRVMAWNLLKYWYNNPQFIADLEKAKREWHSKKDSYQEKSIK